MGDSEPSHRAMAVCLLLSVGATLLSGAVADKPAAASPATNRRMTSAAFAQAGKKDGLEIWRIENFTPVPVKSADYGKFYSADSYLVLKTKDSRGRKSWDIHYWLGKKTSQDESGAAAILAVELDESLGGAPVQHRETQDHESQLFSSYFPSGIRYLDGGVDSGFHHVNPNDPGQYRRLYQVKGKRNIRIVLIEPSASKMNKGDSYILDTGKIIYVYYGANSQGTERLTANTAANLIKSQDHGGRAQLQIIDQSSSPDDVAEFFKALGGGSRSMLKDAKSGGDDDQFERNYDANFVLYKVSDASGSLKVEKVGQKPLSLSLLRSDDSFILDTVTSGIYSWIGRRSTKAEKEEAMKKAQEFLRSKNYPSWTPITRVVEGGEPSTFKQYFANQ